MKRRSGLVTLFGIVLIIENNGHMTNMNIVSWLFSLFMSAISIVILSNQKIVSSMVNHESSYFLGRYCVVITVVLSCIYSLFQGISYFLKRNTCLENENGSLKTLFNVIDAFIVALLSVPWTVSVIETSKKYHWKVIIVILDVIVLLSLISAIKEYKSKLPPPKRHDP